MRYRNSSATETSTLPASICGSRIKTSSAKSVRSNSERDQMTDITCELCSKTFKTESGGRWHVDHLYQLPSHQAHGEINAYEQRDEAADEVESPSPGVPEQPVDAMSDERQSPVDLRVRNGTGRCGKGTQRTSSRPGP